MREITEHSYCGPLNQRFKIEAADDPGKGGAHCSYDILAYGNNEWQPFTKLRFQKGLLDESGPPNGLSNEVLLAIVADRLACFQTGKFACIENQAALERVKEALGWLEWRSRDRNKRGVINTHLA